mmetsp:Transcript_57074/g.139065  ORF Transcript_57074/g.139065 Transcript_57074/m.139065 type:complete len:87 (+) Transcript_57074:1035-1295(+)
MQSNCRFCVINPLTIMNAPITKHSRYLTTDGLDNDPDDPDAVVFPDDEDLGGGDDDDDDCPRRLVIFLCYFSTHRNMLKNHTTLDT